MESHPAATVFHIFFKRITFAFRAWNCVDDYHHIVGGKFVIVVAGKAGGNIKNIAVAHSEILEEIYGLLSKLHMGGFGSLTIAKQGFESRCFGVIARIITVLSRERAHTKEQDHCNHGAKAFESFHFFIILIPFYKIIHKNKNLAPDETRRASVVMQTNK